MKIHEEMERIRESLGVASLSFFVMGNGKMIVQVTKGPFRESAVLDYNDLASNVVSLEAQLKVKFECIAGWKGPNE